MDNRPEIGYGLRIVRRRLAALVAFTLIPTWPAFADNAALSDLQINGFGTVGSIATQISQPWTFRRDVSQPSGPGGYANALIDSRVGVQINYSLGPQWELVAQAVAKRQASEAPISQLIQWAFIAYKPLPDLTLHLGRRSQGLFLLADYRDVDFAFPWVRPSTEFYGWIPYAPADGLDVTWNWQTGNINWKVIAAYASAHNTVPAPPLDTPVKTAESFGPFAALSGEYNGLTVKLSYHYTHGTLSNNPQLDQLMTVLHQLEPILPATQAAEDAQYIDRLTINHTFSRYVGFGVMYDRDAWLIHSEISRINGGVQIINGWHGYTSIGYRIGPVTPFVMAARTLPKMSITPPPSDWATPLAATLTPTLGASAANAAAAQVQFAATQAAQGSNISRMDQRSVSLGMRWDITSQTALKLQWDYFHIYEAGSGLWGQYSADGTTVALGAGYANVFSAAVDFLF